MEVMQQFNNSILHAHTNLEYQTMDNNGTRNVVILIAFIQDSKCKIVKLLNGVEISNHFIKVKKL